MSDTVSTNARTAAANSRGHSSGKGTPPAIVATCAVGSAWRHSARCGATNGSSVACTTEAMNDLLSMTATTTMTVVEALAMGTLTIRNLDDPLKSRLRMRAAARNRSMEEEARQILRTALQEPLVQTQDLGSRIRARFAALGDVQLPIEARQAVREPPALDEVRQARASGKRKASTPRR